MWDEIAKMSSKVVTPEGFNTKMYLFPTLPVIINHNSEVTYWMVGKYKDQIEIARKIRENPNLQHFLGREKIRLGLRETDVAPANIPRIKSYGNTVPGANRDIDFTSNRKDIFSNPVRGGQLNINRLSDREDNVFEYWKARTPESHHIVEFNNLRDIGKSTKNGSGELDHDQLPCVLLVAEFHQRYISSMLKHLHGKDSTRLRMEMVPAYKNIYATRGVALEPLWKVSEIILRRAAVI